MAVGGGALSIWGKLGLAGLAMEGLAVVLMFAGMNSAGVGVTLVSVGLSAVAGVLVVAAIIGFLVARIKAALRP